MSVIARIFGTLALAMTTPALAQQPQPKLIDAPSGQPFTHANSGMKLPATLDALPRTRIVENEGPQLDIAAEYALPDNSQVITVYVYRATTGAVPVWFDRATWAVENRPTFGTPTRLDRPAALTPPGQATASAMVGTWNLAGSSYRSTGLALVPMGEWLVKLRYSSTTLDAAALDAKLRAAIAALTWPATIPPAPVAAAVADCAGGLKLGGRAKPAKTDAASAMFGGLLAGMGKPDPKAPPVVWCRDSTKLALGGVYRANAADNAYLLALSDAGRGVSVGPNGLAAALDKNAKPSWTVDLILPGRTVSYPAQDRLPPPEQVLQLLSGPAMSSTTTWGQKRDIQVSPNALK